MKALRALSTFRRGAAFRPWLARIVSNEAISTLRARRRNERLVLRLREPPDAPPAASAEDLVVDRERKEQVLVAFSRLRPRDRTVLAYRYFFDMSEREMSEALGCSPGTVKSRLSRALVRLRSDLAASEDWGEVSA